MNHTLKLNLPPKINYFNMVLLLLFTVTMVALFDFGNQYLLLASLTATMVFLLSLGPEKGLYLVALFFPFISLEISAFSKYNVPYVDLLVMMVFLAFAFRRFWHWLHGHEPLLKKEDLPGIGIFTLFILASLLSAFNAPNYLHSLKFVARPLVFFYLMFVFLPYNVVKTKQVLKNICAVFLADGIIISLMAIASIFVIERKDFFRLLPIPIFGVYPLGTNQNLIAESLVVIIPFAAMLAVWAEKEWTKKLIEISMVLMGLVTLATFSRAGWLTLFVELSTFTFFYFRFNLKKIMPALVIGLAVLLPLFFYLAQLLSSDISRKATENRYLLTEIAWDAFKHHPWIGNGAGRYMGIVAINRDYIKTFGQPLDSHGFLQKLMAEEGTLGLVTFLAFLGYVLKRIWSRLKDKTLSPDARKVVLASLIAVSGGIIFQLFNTSYYVSKLWLPIGVALVVMRLIEKKEIV